MRSLIESAWASGPGPFPGPRGRKGDAAGRATKSQERFWTANAGPVGRGAGRGRAIAVSDLRQSKNLDGIHVQGPTDAARAGQSLQGRQPLIEEAVQRCAILALDEQLRVVPPRAPAHRRGSRPEQSHSAVGGTQILTSSAG